MKPLGILRSDEKIETKHSDVIADHYRQFPIETIELIIRVWGWEHAAYWCEITAFKYRMRLGHKRKDASISIDLEKEKWYLDKAKEIRENAK